MSLRNACWVSLLALLGLGAAAQAADGELTIGFVSPVTGNFAELGTAMRNGGQYAIDAVNAAGGLKVGAKTYTLKYVVGDTEGSAERAISAARRLIEIDHVHAIIGYALATDFLASMPLLQDSKVPSIDTSGRADSIPERIAERSSVDFHMANAITERREFSELTLPFFDGYKARWGFYPPFYAVQTYDGALMLLDAIRRAKLTDDLVADRTAIRDGLASIDEQHPVTGARGSLWFSSLETGRVVPIRKIITQYQPGNKTVIVWPLDQAGQFIDPRK